MKFTVTATGPLTPALEADLARAVPGWIPDGELGHPCNLHVETRLQDDFGNDVTTVLEIAERHGLSVLGDPTEAAAAADICRRAAALYDRLAARLTEPAHVVTGNAG